MSANTKAADVPVLQPKDFASDQDVRWCPGCGDYSILAQVKKVLAKIGARPEKTVFISGIGCSSRFPYYMNTYGFHSIHGRAPTFATGVKVANPELSVWIATGDGDGLSIGGNHLMHVIRRNVDVNILLFNNRIYGLTKGQYSPTSEHGKKTKSSPMGTVEWPVRPLSIALGAEATFAARAIDVDVKHLEYVLERAATHRGTSFVEIYQNCNIFNDGAYGYATDRTAKPDNVIYLEHGKPLTFGRDAAKGIRLHNLRPEVVNVEEVGPDDLLIHDEQAREPSLAYMLSRMRYPEFPEPVGVFRCVDAPCFDTQVRDQVREAQAKAGDLDFDSIIAGPETWTVA
ncbi:MAG: 2-oxoglutarate oxidoreductase subunit KorB [Phycisphaerae bacterium]|nr:2-oxoglutarate oxidoreductase subunit KorB [Phycisphaerae bacterium]